MYSHNVSFLIISFPNDQRRNFMSRFRTLVFGFAVLGALLMYALWRPFIQLHQDAHDFSVFNSANEGCRVKDPSGRSIVLSSAAASSVVLVPKGSTITSECFLQFKQK